MHRSGRTARASSEGTAYTFVTEKEQQKFAAIEALLEKTVTKAQVPEQFGETPAYNPRPVRTGGSGGGGGTRRFNGPPRGANRR